MNRPVEINDSVQSDSDNLREELYETDDQIALKLSSVEELRVPEFDISTEAEAMMAQMGDISAKDRYVLTTLDLIRQKMDWMLPRLKIFLEKYVRPMALVFS